MPLVTGVFTIKYGFSVIDHVQLRSYFIYVKPEVVIFVCNKMCRYYVARKVGMELKLLI